MKIANEEKMIQLGVNFARQLMPGDVVELIGDVGAGKTTFMRGVLRGLGSSEQAVSPSYTISCEYQTTRARVVHFDFYRLLDGAMVGHEVEEAIGGGESIVAIEWSNVLDISLPISRYVVVIDYAKNIDERTVSIRKNNQKVVV